MEAAITTLFGAIAAEEVIYGRLFINSICAFESIERLLLNMPKFGLFGKKMFFSPITNNEFPYTSEHLSKIGDEISKIRDECYARARSIVEKNVDLIRFLTPHLASKERLKEKEVMTLIKEFNRA